MRISFHHFVETSVQKFKDCLLLRLRIYETTIRLLSSYLFQRNVVIPGSHESKRHNVLNKSKIHFSGDV